MANIFVNPLLLTFFVLIRTQQLLLFKMHVKQNEDRHDRHLIMMSIYKVTDTRNLEHQPESLLLEKSIDSLQRKSSKPMLSSLAVADINLSRCLNFNQINCELRLNLNIHEVLINKKKNALRLISII